MAGAKRGRSRRRLKSLEVLCARSTDSDPAECAQSRASYEVRRARGVRGELRNVAFCQRQLDVRDFIPVTSRELDHARDPADIMALYALYQTR